MVDLSAKHCERCEKLFGVGARLLSYMNTETICIDCSANEQGHPYYQLAKEAELEQVREGNYNYPGLFAGQKYPYFKLPEPNQGELTQ